MKNKKGAKQDANEIKYTGEKLSFDQYSQNAPGGEQETEKIQGTRDRGEGGV